MNPQQPGQVYGPQNQPGDDIGNGAQPAVPPTPQPQQQTDTPLYSPDAPKNEDKKRNRILIALGSLILLFVIVVVVTLALSGNGSPPAEETPANNQHQGPQPAAAIDVEQTNDSINQDISSLNDLSDFPENELDDRSLGL